MPVINPSDPQASASSDARRAITGRPSARFPAGCATRSCASTSQLSLPSRRWTSELL